LIRPTSGARPSETGCATARVALTVLARDPVRPPVWRRSHLSWRPNGIRIATKVFLQATSCRTPHATCGGDAERGTNGWRDRPAACAGGGALPVPVAGGVRNRILQPKLERLRRRRGRSGVRCGDDRSAFAGRRSERSVARLTPAVGSGPSVARRSDEDRRFARGESQAVDAVVVGARHHRGVAHPLEDCMRHARVRVRFAVRRRPAIPAPGDAKPAAADRPDRFAGSVERQQGQRGRRDDSRVDDGLLADL